MSQTKQILEQGKLNVKFKHCWDYTRIYVMDWSQRNKSLFGNLHRGGGFNDEI